MVADSTKKNNDTLIHTFILEEVQNYSTSFFLIFLKTFRKESKKERSEKVGGGGPGGVDIHKRSNSCTGHAYNSFSSSPRTKHDVFGREIEGDSLSKFIFYFYFLIKSIIKQ